MKKSVVSAILAVSLVLSMGGCGFKAKNDSKVLVGNWKADLECEKIVKDESRRMKMPKAIIWQ